MVIRRVVLRHDMHGMGGILGGWLWRRGLELGDVRRYHLVLPFLKRDWRDEMAHYTAVDVREKRRPTL